MRSINIVSLILLAIGGINWGLVGLFNLNLIALAFGEGTAVSAIVYTLVGLAAIWQVFAFRWTLDHEEEYIEMRQSTQQHA